MSQINVLPRQRGPFGWWARVRRLFAGPDSDQAPIAAAPVVPVREIFRRFWPYTRRYRIWLLLDLFLVALGPVIETGSIWMFKILVDRVLVPRDFGPFPWIAAAYIGLAVGGGAISFSEDVVSAWVGERFVLEMRTSFFRHLHSLSLDFFEQRRLGDILSRLTGDIGSIEDLVLSGVTDVLSLGLRIVFFVGALLYLRWDLALISLIITPLFWLVARGFARLIKDAAREQRRRSGSISAVAEESLANVALVQAYNRQPTEVERFSQQALASFQAQMRSTRIRALYRPLVDLIEVAGSLLVVGIGTWALSRGLLSFGGLLVFLAYLTRLYSPIRGLGRLSNSVQSASAGAERIIEFLDQRPAIVERPNARPLHRARGLIVFDDVSFRYPPSLVAAGNTSGAPAAPPAAAAVPATDAGERDAIAGISFRVHPGETLALVGPSGAGKSTITKLLLRFYDPAGGRILLDGIDVRDLRLHALREQISVVLQETLVFDGTIRENIAYGRPEATEAEIVQAAIAADAHEFILSLPKGYETSVGQRGRRLSGGQRQRIAIARAMIRNAPILILDEPTTGLDAESSRRVLEPLRRLMAGRTTIVVSHNLLTVRYATAIVVLDEGRIVEYGTHEELVAQNGIYAHLYRQHLLDAVAQTLTGSAPPESALPSTTTNTSSPDSPGGPGQAATPGTSSGPGGDARPGSAGWPAAG